MFHTYTPLHYKLTLLCAYSFQSRTWTHLDVAIILDSPAATKIHPAGRRNALKACERVYKVLTVSLCCCASKVLTFVNVCRMSLCYRARLTETTVSVLRPRDPITQGFICQRVTHLHHVRLRGRVVEVAARCRRGDKMVQGRVCEII